MITRRKFPTVCYQDQSAVKLLALAITVFTYPLSRFANNLKTKLGKAISQFTQSQSFKFHSFRWALTDPHMVTPNTIDTPPHFRSHDTNS